MKIFKAAYLFEKISVTPGMKAIKTILIVVATIAGVMPLAAHHSFNAEYDLTRPGYLDGKITMIQLVNPHSNIFIDVTDKNGNTVNWTIEIGSATGLIKGGWTKDTLQVGMEICVDGFPDKMGIAKFGSTSITLKPTGRVLPTSPGKWMSMPAQPIASSFCTPHPAR